MTTPQADRGDGKPRCYGIEMPATVVVNDGYEHDLVETHKVALTVVSIPFAFSRECKSWASDPSTDPVPMQEGWRCEGCPRLSPALVELAIHHRERRLQKKPAG